MMLPIKLFELYGVHFSNYKFHKVFRSCISCRKYAPNRFMIFGTMLHWQPLSLKVSLVFVAFYDNEWTLKFAFCKS